MPTLALLFTALLLQEAQDARGHWPQWRGPDRDNRSTETGLLKEWPNDGPSLLWSTGELGDGIPPISVAGGRIYGIGFRDHAEAVTSLDGKGTVVWSVPIGPRTGEAPLMRFLNQRPISVDDQNLYAFVSGGTLFCLRAKDGSIVWKRDYSELGVGRFPFFVCDTPLVDGPLLICKPGGNQGHLAALDKATGKTAWQSVDFKDPPTHAPLIVAEIAGRRQYIVLSMTHVAGIAAETGALLWSAERPGKTAVASTPIYRDGTVFVTSGYGVGGQAFKITQEEGTFHAAELYSNLKMGSLNGDWVLVGEHLYGCSDRDLNCVEWKTGTVVWQQPLFGRGNVTYADGHLLVREVRGSAVALVDASPAAFHETGRLVLPRLQKDALPHAVLAGGRLYLRDPQTLYCYDLRGPDYQEPPAVWKPPGPAPTPSKVSVPPRPKTDAAFVPTPHDVVKRMLELARVGKEDVVYDLGSGDGRIVIAAARDYGSKAVGFEIDPDLVKESRREVTRLKLESLVTIEDRNLFSADLSGATVVTLYLGPENNARLLPQLRKLKPKSRVVSHQHRLGEAGPEPDERLILISNQDSDPHAVYLWNLPFKEDK